MKEEKKYEILKNIEQELQKLIMFRGTTKEIVKKINLIGLRNDSIIEPSEENENNKKLGFDYCFNTNLGMLNNQYIDYEIWMLPTNKKNTWIITEINSF